MCDFITQLLFIHLFLILFGFAWNFLCLFVCNLAPGNGFDILSPFIFKTIVMIMI